MPELDFFELSKQIKEIENTFFVGGGQEEWPLRSAKVQANITIREPSGQRLERTSRKPFQLTNPFMAMGIIRNCTRLNP